MSNALSRFREFMERLESSSPEADLYYEPTDEFGYGGTLGDLRELLRLAEIGQRETRKACANCDMDEVVMHDLHIPGGEG